jgi:putative chitinase
MALTVQSLVAAGCSRSTAAAHLPHILRAMAAEEIDTPVRARHFLAQALYESGLLKFMEEIWGPTKWQVGYEGRKDLGNTRQGDGFRFRGRGPFMLTGRANYTAFGKKLGRPFADKPDLVSEPADGWLVAAQYWSDRGLNKLADRGDARGITRAINGAATDGDPSHHLRRMEIFGKLPENCSPDPFRVLTREEREIATELEAERRSARRHGGWDKIDASHLKRAKELKDQLRAFADAVRKAAEAEPRGWTINRRRERLKILMATIGS